MLHVDGQPMQTNCILQTIYIAIYVMSIIASIYMDQISLDVLNFGKILGEVRILRCIV